MDRKTSTEALRRRIKALEAENDALRRNAARDDDAAALLRGILKHCPSAIYAKDLSGRFLFANDKFETASGYTQDEIIGRTDHQLFSEPMAKMYAAEDREVLRTGKPLRKDRQIGYGEKRNYWIKTKFPLRDERGNPTGVCAIATNITELTEAEEALRWESTVNKASVDLARAILSAGENLETITRIILAYARQITDSLHGYVSIIDPETGNNVSLTLTAMMEDGQCGVKDGGIIFPVGENGFYPTLWGHSFNTREPFFTNDPTAHPASTGLPEGHIRLNRFLSVPVLIEGKPGGQIALANPSRDYTDKDLEAVEQLGGMYALALHRHRYQEERRNLQRLVQQSQKLESLGVLAGGIAHDFNNILFPVIGYIEMSLDQLPGDHPVRNYQVEALKAAGRARDLVRQILTFSRRSETELQPLRCQLVVKEVLKLMRSSLPSYIEMEQEIDDGCGPILGDPSQIHSIVMNLCTNAGHAMQEEGGRLRVSLRETALSEEAAERLDLPAGPYVRITVADTGTGMAEGVIDRVFEPYFTTKTQGKGVGLGLSVVHGIVRSYRGNIRVSSEPGRGTTFRIFLPRLRGMALPLEAEADHSPTPGRGERILVVDDEAPIAEVAEKMLAQLGYRPTTFTSSPEALERFRQAPDAFDLVLTDMAMPHLRGDRLAGEIMALRPDIPVILCTGFSERISAETAAGLGIREFLLKPMGRDELSRVIRRALDGTGAGPTGTGENN